MLAPSVAGDWVIPWVSNRDGEWASEVVLNNLGTEAVMVSLSARRANGESELYMLEIAAESQVVLAAADTFTTLASGPGYALFINAPTDHLSGAVRLASLRTDSGFSPAMGAAIPLEHAATNLIFSTLPIDGFSAPVVVNPGDQAVTIQMRAHTDEGPFGQTVTRTIEAGHPFADVTTNLFPDLDRPAYVVVVAEAPVLGANFSFNSTLEPAMINATPSPLASDSLVEPLLAGLETTATATNAYLRGTSDWYGKGIVTTCPAVDSDINLGQPESFITAELDWGSGCTNALGVYHSGLIHLAMARNGNLQDGAWMNGAMTFESFITRYYTAAALIDGDVRFEGSTASENLSLTADLTLAADAPVFSGATDLTLKAQLNANRDETTYRVYGSLELDVAASSANYLTARVASDDPLIYDYNTCPWPSDGRLNFLAFYSGLRLEGWLDFETQSCQTAQLNLNGITTELDLSTVVQ